MIPGVIARAERFPAVRYTLVQRPLHRAQVLDFVEVYTGAAVTTVQQLLHRRKP